MSRRTWTSSCRSFIKQPVYIVGPCAAESREQVMETAKAISDLRLEIGDWRFIFRAGVWKPRTSPYTFQGIGEPALAWLQEVKQKYGMEVATEVATPEHVEAALKAGIDYLWIGARSSATPIVVQSLADSICDLRFDISNLKGILIKNPVNNDADLWLGNIERLEKTGVPVMAVHRGCNHQPCWSMAHKVRLARPDIPMLLDPSHMSGDAAKVPELLKKVEELGLDGAMVEVHAHPESALSDRKQQIRPEEIRDWRLEIGDRRLETGDWRLEIGDRRLDIGDWRLDIGDVKDIELNWLRAEIDELDERLWDTIAARMDVSKRIGAWKKEHGVAALQPERYKQIVERLRVNGYGLSEEFMLRIWEIIHEESLKQQK